MTLETTGIHTTGGHTCGRCGERISPGDSHICGGTATIGVGSAHIFSQDKLILEKLDEIIGLLKKLMD